MTGIPYTSLITVLGFALGWFYEDMGYFGEAIFKWSTMGAHDMLLLFLPALLFESAFNTDYHIMKN